MSRQYTIPVQLIQSLLQAPERQGVDIKRVLESNNLSHLIDLISSDNQRIDLNDVGALLNGLWREMDDEASGFLSRPLKVGFFSMMCHVFITAGNLRRGLLRCAKFVNLVTDDFSLQIEDIGDESHIIINYENPHDIDQVFFVTFLSAIWIRLSCWMVNQPLLLERIQFTFDQPEFHDEFSQMFPCRNYFSQERNSIVFNKRLMSLSIKQDSDSLAIFLNHEPNFLLTQFRADTSLTAQIKRLLLHRQGIKTELDNMNFEGVSEALDMTPHTLRRRLKEEGNSFQQIKDSLRCDRAIQLLSHLQMPISDIAIELGFSESAAFNRAFKKWTGLTPGVFRENL